MKGLGRLIGNENKKVWKQTGLRVILIIIAALTALSPVFNFLTSRALTYEGYGNYMYDPDNIQNQIGYAQESEDVLREKYWRVYESTVNFVTEISIVSEWQIYFFRLWLLVLLLQRMKNVCQKFLYHLLTCPTFSYPHLSRIFYS